LGVRIMEEKLRIEILITVEIKRIRVLQKFLRRKLKEKNIKRKAILNSFKVLDTKIKSKA
jgi:hypothetical protein